MNRSLLEKYSGRQIEQAGGRRSPEPVEEAEQADDLGAFGWLRGPMRERAVMLELRKRTGDILAIGYGWLERVEFDPSEGVTLHTARQEIRIKGRNLNAEVRPGVRFFEGITRHRVPWVQESDQSETIEAQEGVAVIESIAVTG